MEEKRKNERFSIDYPSETHRDGQMVPIDLIDLSRGGISLRSDENIEQNEEIRLWVFLKHKMFELPFSVVYSNRLIDGAYKIGARIMNSNRNFEKYWKMRSGIFAGKRMKRTEKKKEK